MTTRQTFEWSSRSTRSVLGLALLGSAFSACVDTGLDPSNAVACGTTNTAADNLVLVFSDLGSLGAMRCTGVLVTRTLVVTGLGCSMVPNELADSYGREEPPGAPMSTNRYFAGAVDRAACDAGTRREDGSFSTLFGPPLPKEAFEIYLAGERINVDGRPVKEVFRIGDDRCANGIALLRLNSGIGPNAIPVRLEPGAADEPLLLRYLNVGSARTLERIDLPMPRVQTDAFGPRSFALAETCPVQGGAGIFSAATGALVGILTSSLGSADCQTPALGTAIELASFRRALIEAAAPEALEAEPGDSLNLAGCAGP